MTAQVEGIPSNVQAAIETPTPDFSKSRYAEQMTAIYLGFISLFNLTPKQAEAVTRAATRDVHDRLKNSKTEFSVGVTSKKGGVNLKEIASQKNAESTPALQCVHALHWAESAGKHGVSYGRTEWSFTEDLSNWIAGLE